MVGGSSGFLAPLGPKPRPKAVLTIQPPNNKIVMANDTAVKLLGLSSEELVGRTLSDLCKTADASGGLTASAISGAFLEAGQSELSTAEGDLVPVYGRFVETSTAGPATLSLWVYPLKGRSSAPKLAFSESLPSSTLRSAKAAESDDRFLVVMEPVTRLSGELTLGPKGRVFQADKASGAMFGCHCESLLLGTPLAELIPSLPAGILASLKTARNLAVAGLRRDSGDFFPLNLALHPHLDEDGEVLKFTVKLEALETISGVLSLDSDASIRAFHTHFLLPLTGRSPQSLLKRHISELLPDFALRAAASASAPASPHPKSDGCRSVPSTSRDLAAQLAELSLHTPEKRNTATGARPPTTSTPRHNGASASLPSEGVYAGHARHADGSRLPVSYHIRRLANGSLCLWLLWQLPPPPPPPSPSTPSADEKEPTAPPKFQPPHHLDMWVGDDALGTTCDALMGSGDYAEAYRTLNQIGKGAFGAVKLAVRRSDSLLVVTKFINKSKVLNGSWTQSKRWGHKVPIELELLSKLTHPNLVGVEDIFENEAFYQLVMERHGSGMDLFEFIDREPKLDEPLVSYIFRQLVAAVAYLDSLGIVHRDLKDENVIIDESYRAKLIDLGSAAYYDPERAAFTTFCGTIEYASPEILLGNRYRGPEAEVWSLGVLLFTLQFGEAPFQTPEETMEAAYVPLWDVSDGLHHLLASLLHPDPTGRARIKEVERHWWLRQPFHLANYPFERVLPSAEPQEIHPAKYLAANPSTRHPKSSETGSE